MSNKKNIGKSEHNEKLIECEKLRDEYLDGWKRAKADLANYKKEEFVRLEMVATYGNEGIIQEIISALDGFKIGIDTLEHDEKAYRGMQLVASQFDDILKRAGVERINAKHGDTFDPSIHEATGFISSTSPPETVVKEVTCGYKLNSKILRPVKVVLSKGSEENKTI